MIDKVSEFIERNFWLYFWGSLFFIMLTAVAFCTMGMAKIFLILSGAAVLSTLLTIGIVKLVEFGKDSIEALKVRKWAEQKEKEKAKDALKYTDEQLSDEEIDIRIARYFQNRQKGQ